MHESSYQLCREFVDRHLNDGPLKIAELGSCEVWGGTYRPLFDRPGWQYTGFDLEPGPCVDVCLGDAETWEPPIDHVGRYDVVISGQTLEHVRRPWVWFPKVVQFCKPGGLIWITAPNTWKFHEYPIDCWRIWPDGLRALFDDAGLQTLECNFRDTDTWGLARRING